MIGYKSSHLTNKSKSKDGKNAKTSLQLVEWTKTELKYNTNDVLKFEVNFADESILIYKNNKFIGKMFNGINDLNRTKWRLVVSGFREKECVEFLQCKGTKAVLPRRKKPSQSLQQPQQGRGQSRSRSRDRGRDRERDDRRQQSPRQQPSPQPQQPMRSASNQEKDEEIRRLRDNQFSICFTLQ